MDPVAVFFSVWLLAAILIALWNGKTKKYKLEFVPFRETSLKKLQLQPASGMLEESPKEIPMNYTHPPIVLPHEPKSTPQDGDTVRLTITVEGVVGTHDGFMRVCGRVLDGPDRTVEVLSRATPPLPNEPGTWWLDNQNDFWQVDIHGCLYCPSIPKAVAATYAPFRQLVLKEVS